MECASSSPSQIRTGSTSRRLKDEFDKGKEYYTLQGKTILLPETPLFRPSAEQLTWHNENRYRP